MRHATDQDLDGIETLLRELRSVAGLSERKRGIFYWKSRAFLHFHEHEGTVYADVRLGGKDFERFELPNTQARRRLVAAVRQYLEPAQR
jgi:hypothetical protein